MKQRHLFCWLGNTDLKAAKSGDPEFLGPIGQAVVSRDFDALHLLSDHADDETGAYTSWLENLGPAEVHVDSVELSSPTDFREIYEADQRLLDAFFLERDPTSVDLVFHLSPGTPAMAAIWIILGKTKYPAELLEASQEAGVQTVSLPFEISADYLPAAVATSDVDILRLTHGLPEPAPEFNDIIHRCKDMQRLIAEARRVAVHDVPVLIHGDSGTGKELLARAIHESSGRKGRPFVEVNCGAIPESLFESEFFGHTKGAFTDAKRDKAGHFERANGGLVFLDEIGELPLSGQVKLLRVLQEGKVPKIGADDPLGVDFRVIAATNRYLLNEVAKKRFRLDLFYRLAVGVLRLPALSERPGDLNLLIDFIVDRLNSEAAGREGWIPKKISAAARNLLNKHPWPGNIRELQNTISRAAIWTAGKQIDAADIQRALFPVPTDDGVDGILNRRIGNGFDVRQVLDQVRKHYLQRAKDEAKTKTEAADLLNLGNPTTLNNWMKELDLDW